MLWQDNVFCGGVYDSVRALLEGSFELLCVRICNGRLVGYLSHKWDNLGRFCDKSMRQLFVEGDQMSDINIAIVLLEKDIFANLVTIAS